MEFICMYYSKRGGPGVSSPDIFLKAISDFMRFGHAGHIFDIK